MTKSQFDGYRQSVYQQAAAIVDKHDAYRNGGALDANALAYFINELDSLMAQFLATYQASRANTPMEVFQGKIEGSWIDPRFHDYYDFFSNDLRRMEAGSRGMTTTSVAPSSPGYVPQEQASGWLQGSQVPGASAVSVTTNVPGFLPTPSLLPSGSEGPSGWESAPGEELVTEQAGISPLLGLGLVAGLLFAMRGRRTAHASKN